MTLPVADYILTDSIGVERKSVPDLVQSINSGRLLKQCSRLVRVFATPTILIELDNRTFKMEGSLLMSKLAVLIMHYPKIRLIWSPSTGFSKEIFFALKDGTNQQPPDKFLQKDYQSGTKQQTADPFIEVRTTDEAKGSDRYKCAQNVKNIAAVDFLQKMPWMSGRVLDTVVRRTRSLKDLLEMDETGLSETIGV